MLLSVQTDLRALGVALFGLSDRERRDRLGLGRARARAAVARLPGDPALARARRGDRHVSAHRRGHGRTVLEFTRASRWYGPVIALNDVTTQVPPGVTGLLGPNGAGKSTFLKLAAGPAAAEPGRGEAARPARLGLARGLPPRGPVSRGGRVLGEPDGPAVPDDAAAPHAATTRPSAGERSDARAPPGGAARRAGPQDRRLQPRHAPAHQARAGDRARPGGAAARRAGDRDGPGQPPARDRPRAAARARGQDRGRLEPHPVRGRGDDAARAARAQRPHPGRGRRARDPRPARRAPAHGGAPRARAAAAGRARWWAGRASLSVRLDPAGRVADGRDRRAPTSSTAGSTPRRSRPASSEMYSPDENLESVFRYLVAR